jgi:hypothetical protein
MQFAGIAAALTLVTLNEPETTANEKMHRVGGAFVRLSD